MIEQVKNLVPLAALALLLGASVIELLNTSKIDVWTVVGIVSICALELAAKWNNLRKEIVSDETLRRDVDSLKNAVSRISLAVGFKQPEK